MGHGTRIHVDHSTARDADSRGSLDGTGSGFTADLGEAGRVLSEDGAVARVWKDPRCASGIAFRNSNASETG